MGDLYKENEMCLEFTNEELMKYLVEPLQKYKNLEMVLEYDCFNQEAVELKEKIVHIVLDGNKEEFFIIFFKHMIAVFILNEEFMFIDDKAKEYQTSSETFGNIVYEGNLRSKTHKEILKEVHDLVIILMETKQIVVEEKVVSQKGIQYPKCEYNVKLIKSNSVAKTIKFENISFNIANSL